jgi:hypothetical protein
MTQKFQQCTQTFGLHRAEHTKKYNSQQPVTNRMKEKGLRKMFMKVTISLD